MGIHSDQEKCILGDTCARLVYAKQRVASSNINIYNRKIDTFGSRWRLRPKKCVSPTRNSRSRAQTSIFTIENQHFLVEMAPQASWPPDVPAESLEAWSPQPGVLSQASSARNPQPGVLSKIPQPGVSSQESSARSPQPGFFGPRIPQPGVSSQSVWGPRWSHFNGQIKLSTDFNMSVMLH